MKAIIYIFCGTLAVILVAILTGIGGAIGAGSSILIGEMIHNIFVASIFGGVLAGYTFHFVCKKYEVMAYAWKNRDRENKTANPFTTDQPIDKERLEKPLTQGNKHLWGSLSYLLSTILGVNIVYALAGPSWQVVIAIIVSGLLGMLGLIPVLLLKLWQPLKFSK